jgi:hypothetical protein
MSESSANEVSDMNDTDQSDSILNRVCIAMPCNIGWDNMKGNDEVRLCGGCDKNVYNISAMSKKRAEEILSSPHLPCLRISRDQNGKLITDDCHFFFKPARKIWRTVLSLASSIIALISAMQPAQAQAQNESPKEKVPVDRTMVQTERVTITGGRPCTGSPTSRISLIQRLAPKQAIQVEGQPIDPRHYRSPDQAIQRKNMAIYEWPRPLQMLGISMEDLPELDAENIKQLMELAPTDIVIERLEKTQVNKNIDTLAWEKFEQARELHAKACFLLMKAELQEASKVSTQSLASYDQALALISANNHDARFSEFVFIEKTRIQQVNEIADREIEMRKNHQQAK